MSAFRHPKSLTGFLEEELESSDAPLFDWSETDHLDEVLAKEAFQITNLEGGFINCDQVLGRKDGKLVYYDREITRYSDRSFKTSIHWGGAQGLSLVETEGDSERLLKTSIHWPASGQRAMIEPVASSLVGLLVLTPVSFSESNSDEMWESERTISGRWRNRQRKMNRFRFRSHDRAYLEALRRTLIGDRLLGSGSQESDNTQEDTSAH